MLPFPNLLNGFALKYLPYFEKNKELNTLKRATKRAGQ
jgi:hypothetical protein